MRRDRNLILHHASEKGCDFSGRKLDYFCAIASQFEQCRFERMAIRDTCFGGGTTASVYIQCSFDGSVFDAQAPGTARFLYCSFRNVLIRKLFCQRVEFVGCTFSGKLLSGYFNGAIPKDVIKNLDRSSNEFRDNDFSQMEMIDVAFRTGIDLAIQKLPVGSDYIYISDGPKVVAEARRQVIEWKDLDLRQNALTVLRILELQLEGGQQQLFLRTTDLMPKNLKEASEMVFSLLQSYDPK